DLLISEPSNLRFREQGSRAAYLVRLSQVERSAPRSEPAKSMKLRHPTLSAKAHLSCNIACERDDLVLAPVEPTNTIRDTRRPQYAYRWNATGDLHRLWNAGLQYCRSFFPPSQAKKSCRSCSHMP